MSTWQKSTQNPSQILIGEHYVIFFRADDQIYKTFVKHLYLIRTSFREIYTSEIKCHRKKKIESQKKLDKHEKQRHVELMHRHK